MPPCYLEQSWGQLAYETEGDQGAWLLFLHGTGCDNRDWDGVRACLKGKPFRLLFLEFRGHGASSVFPGPFSIGMTALAAARQKPDAVESVILFEGWTALRAGTAFGPNRFYGNLPSQAIARITAKSLATRRRHTPDHWTAFWSSVQAFDGSDVLAAPSCLVREVYGAMGRRPDSEKRLLVPVHPRIAWSWIPDCGHYIPLEKPAETAAVCQMPITRSGSHAPPEDRSL
jgi:pimeloyl-ACP methyl ester carboxylesterase